MERENGRLSQAEKRTVQRAKDRYEQSLVSGNATRRQDGDIGEQARRYHNAIKHLRNRLKEVKELLMAQGVPLIQFVRYCNFALHIDRLCRQYSGTTLNLEVRIAMNRWLASGLKRELLEAICREVFELELS